MSSDLRRMALSARSWSSIWSLIMRASASRSSRAARSAGDSLGGGAVTTARGSEASKLNTMAIVAVALQQRI